MLHSFLYLSVSSLAGLWLLSRLSCTSVGLDLTPFCFIGSKGFVAGRSIAISNCLADPQTGSTKCQGFIHHMMVSSHGKDG
ncbi:hypothetical protein CPB84DRAFT_1793223, partial [Gymnopilus junonius]